MLSLILVRNVGIVDPLYSSLVTNDFVFKEKTRTFLRRWHLMTVSHRSNLERQHLMTRIQPFLYTVHSKMSFRSPRWNMTNNCRSCSVIPSIMCTSNVRRHYGCLLRTVSCILLALGYRATNYWHHVLSPRHQPICLSVRHIRPHLLLYHCPSVTTFPTDTLITRGPNTGTYRLQHLFPALCLWHRKTKIRLPLRKLLQTRTIRE